MSENLQPGTPHSDEAKQYLASLLNKQLTIYTTDDRFFTGEFKCTDNECNVILSRAFEYRYPDAAIASEAVSRTGTARLEAKSRFMGLIVVPGKHITKIEMDDRGAGR